MPPQGLFAPGAPYFGANLASVRLPAAWTPPSAIAGLNPDLFIDFVANQALNAGSTVSATSLLTVSRASTKTNLVSTSASGFVYSTFSAGTLATSPGLGALIEEARTNIFLNSTAPATQTITLAATGNYTLWVNGGGSAAIAAGSATITGAGTASQGTPVTINCTATGTVTVTVTGSLNAAQLEAGASASSFIVTAGASVPRAADVVTLTSPPTFTSAYTIYAQGTQLAPTNFATTTYLLNLSDGTATNMATIFRTGGAQQSVGNLTGGSGASVTSGNFVQNVSAKAALAVAASDQAFTLNGAAPGTGTAAVLPSGIAQVTFGNRVSDGLRAWDGFISQVAIWKAARISNANLQTITT